MPSTPKKILVLGHRGMLGNAVLKYFSSLPEYEVATLTSRFGEKGFIEEIKEKSPNYIINCIGIIPQKKPDLSLYKKINIDLPIVLEGLGIRTIHPSTDCEFAGTINRERMYSKKDVRDATDDYGKSKAIISEKIEEEFRNTKIIRTSIVGHEEKTHLSLLDWFLNSKGSVNGYTNHYWNGINTLEWAKQCGGLIENWDSSPTLNQLGTKEIRSKYDLLNDIKKVYDKDIKVESIEAPITINKCLEPDVEIQSILGQLQELRIFYATTKILITGATGFIGKNLKEAVGNIPRFEVFSINTSTTEENITEYVKNADYIIHAAGVTRPENPKDFYSGNIDLTEKIANILISNNKRTPIIYTSSFYALADTDYGRTKKASEDILLEYGKRTDSPIYIFRLPNVFGKGVRLKYKFVVSNFCYSTAHDLPFSISNPEAKINLLYVGDLVSCITNIIQKKNNPLLEQASLNYFAVSNVYTTTLGNLATIIKKFKQFNEEHREMRTENEFEGKLYDTYLYYAQSKNLLD